MPSKCSTLLILLSFIGVSTVVAQPWDYRPPLDGTLRLSGNFGEVRSNHFHTGLDLKTGGVEGLPVYAIADGFVARVNVSPNGYGKAVYLEHPDGHTSVYAHLSRFADDLAAYVREQQYAKESFAVDLSPPAARFRVAKGDIIAYSGNSGSSGGPHVHFEIRETNGQVPVNPLRFGFDVRDDRPPVIERLWVYNHAANGHVEGMAHERMLELEKVSGRYRLKNRTHVTALGSISFGVAALDRFTHSENVCGIHQMSVSVDSVVIHRHSIDRVPFPVKRMVNAHIDHAKKQRYRDVVYRSYIAPMNRLEVYANVQDNGMWPLAAGAEHEVSIVFHDQAGNRSELLFMMRGEGWPGDITPPPGEVRDLFLPQEDNNFSTENMRLSIPKGCLYDTLRFQYMELPACAGCLTPVHAICDLGVPAEDYMNVSLRLNGNLRADRSKLLIVSFDSKGRPIAEGGSVNGQWISTRTRSFGNYAVMQDTLPPTLRPKNFTDGSTVADKRILSVSISDDLSGIASYRATLNGKWILMEHDPKNRVLHYTKDEHFTSGENELHITATDGVGNRSELRLEVR